MKLKEQIAQQPARQRASLPPEERTASYHRVGTRAGMHPEDTPYITTNRTSARRYDLIPYANRGEPLTEELPRQGNHPFFYIGICLAIMVLFLTAYTLIPPALQQWSADRVYGYPRTYQT